MDSTATALDAANSGAFDITAQAVEIVSGRE